MASVWNELDHPRDWRGRFITKGSHVTVAGGLTGTVTAVRPGRLEGDPGQALVRLPDGRESAVPTDQLTVAEPPRGTAYISDGSNVGVGDSVVDSVTGEELTVRSINENGSISVTDGREVTEADPEKLLPGDRMERETKIPPADDGALPSYDEERERDIDPDDELVPAEIQAVGSDGQAISVGDWVEGEDGTSGPVTEIIESNSDVIVIYDGDGGLMGEDQSFLRRIENPGGIGPEDEEVADPSLLHGMGPTPGKSSDRPTPTGDPYTDAIAISDWANETKTNPRLHQEAIGLLTELDSDDPDVETRLEEHDAEWDRINAGEYGALDADGVLIELNDTVREDGGDYLGRVVMVGDNFVTVEDEDGDTIDYQTEILQKITEPEGSVNAEYMSPPREVEEFSQWGDRAEAIANNPGPLLSTLGDALREGDRDALKKAIHAAYNGPNGTVGNDGARIEFTRVSNGSRSGDSRIKLLGKIKSKDGEDIGSIERTIIYENGAPVEVHNDYLSINRDHQGQGIANDIYANQENWFIRDGVEKITILANIDVGGYCVPDRAQILTRRGWLKHDEILAHEDETLGWNAALNVMEWTTIRSVPTFPDSQFITLANRDWSFTATPGHRVVASRLTTTDGKPRWTDYALTPLHELLTPDGRMKNGRKIKVSAPVAVADTSGLSVDQAALLAWLVTDGWVTTRTRSTRTHPETCAGISQTRPEGRVVVTALLNSLGGWGGHWGTESTYVPASVLRELYSVLGREYGSSLKIGLESVVASMGTEQVHAFADAAYLAEGDSSSRMRFWQNPGPVMEACRLAFFMTGKRVTVTQGQVNKFCESFAIGRPHVTAEKIEVTDAGREDSWCVTTDIGSWTVQLDGHTMLTGNSWARAGFDYEDVGVATSHINTMARRAAEYYGEDSDVYQQLDAMRRQLSDAYYDDDVSDEETSFPTPFELSRIGYEDRYQDPDTGRMMWAGKELMLGTNWDAVKYLVPPTESSNNE